MCDFDVETIVIDNGSTDGSVDGLTSSPTFRLITNARNTGFGQACNLGARLARGDWLLFLNPDTILVPDNLQAMSDYLALHPEIAIAGGQVFNEDNTLQRPCRRKFPTPRSAFRRLFLPRNIGDRWSDYELDIYPMDQPLSVDAVSGSYLWIRKQLFHDIGGFDEEFFLYGEDLDLCWRVKTAGGEVRYVPIPAAIHKRGQSRAVVAKRALFESHRAMAIFYRKHYADRYFFIVNAAVFTGIWLRALCLLILIAVCPRRMHELLTVGRTPGTRVEKKLGKQSL